MFLTHDTAEAFAVKRNPSLSFPFLKENGELLSICVNSGVLIEPRAMTLYQDFYGNAHRLTQRYPQYYRFTLGMVLDLETGGMKGQQGRALAKFVTDENLVMFDTCDVRKLETLNMLRQAGELSSANAQLYDDIIDRVESFIQNPNWYTKFNKPLFYDLTHIIFFLTDYGKRPIPLKSDLRACLMHMGTLALLDNDADLLAEVAVCLMYTDQPVPQYWDKYLTCYSEDIRVTYSGTIASALNPTVDEYHVYLVLAAYHAARQRPVFQTKFKGRTPSFYLPDPQPSVLEKLSNYAHTHHFLKNRQLRSLDQFTVTLEEAEYSHWTKALKASAKGQELVHAFSGCA